MQPSLRADCAFIIDAATGRRQTRSWVETPRWQAVLYGVASDVISCLAHCIETSERRGVRLQSGSNERDESLHTSTGFPSLEATLDYRVSTPSFSAPVSLRHAAAEWADCLDYPWATSVVTNAMETFTVTGCSSGSAKQHASDLDGHGPRGAVFAKTQRSGLQSIFAAKYPLVVMARDSLTTTTA
ncbi:hypothetical protein BC835DRAFT_648967 [Cytidiella melzeri]|nr:hypothetical protein BC835DRAFT_648967 [Cytidiella melzeri]